MVSGKITNLSVQNPDGSVKPDAQRDDWLRHPVAAGAQHAGAGGAAGEVRRSIRRAAVRQLALMDWYTSYELQVRLLPVEQNGPGDGLMAGARTDDTAWIQDVFNEFNVQIMSPNFVLHP